MKKIAAIGVDIGGTSVKLGLVDSQARVIARDSFLTKLTPGRERLIREIARRVEGLAAAAKKKGLKVAGVGIGAPGPIDVERGFVYFFPNIPGWKNTPLKSLLSKKVRMPVYVDNDANAMALGEFRFGAGRGVKDGIALTLGTGVGGGMIVGGKLFHGPSYSAAEIGHIIINEDGPLCGCGNHGCVETYVGNGYFVEETRRRMRSGRKTLLTKWLKEGKVLTPELVQHAAWAGDRLSKEVWSDAAGHLATALAGLVNVLNPEKIILGGGLAQSKNLLFDPLKRSLKKKAFTIASRSVRVVPAVLGTDAGLIGAAALALETP